MPIILVIWEAEIERIGVQGQPMQKLLSPPSQPMGENGGAYLSSQLHGKAQIGGL
jgi:hypothetical protein